MLSETLSLSVSLLCLFIGNSFSHESNWEVCVGELDKLLVTAATPFSTFITTISSNVRSFMTISNIEYRT